MSFFFFLITDLICCSDDEAEEVIGTTRKRVKRSKKKANETKDNFELPKYVPEVSDDEKEEEEEDLERRQQEFENEKERIFLSTRSSLRGSSSSVSMSLVSSIFFSFDSFFNRKTVSVKLWTMNNRNTWLRSQ